MDLKENQGTKQSQQEEECSVVVAVHIRPLIIEELQQGCCETLYVNQNTQKEVVVGFGKPECSFQYDYVYGQYGGTNTDFLYQQCIQPLIDGLFRGYNATVFAYGQTGSGKTYTMGSAFKPGGLTTGVIPNVLDSIFQRMNETQKTEFQLRVSFVEIHKEEVHDLLVLDQSTRPNVQIREVPGSGVCLAGATERVVTTKYEMLQLLQQGTLCRATAATGMNERSSRSHAIFSITLEQKKLADSDSPRPNTNCPTGETIDEDNNEEDQDQEQLQDEIDTYLCAKIHLVDLAGSERAKRTKAVGLRFEEAKAINKGLLALGNVINKLVDGASHIPYRDSKLTRLLQDSLGGNSRTVMIACVSPADINFDETLNTLRYAARARNIKNKPVVNRDPQAAQIAFLRQRLAQAQAEITSYKNQLSSNSHDDNGRSHNAINQSQQSFQLGTYQQQVLTQLRELVSKQEKELDTLQLENKEFKDQLNQENQDRIQLQIQRDTLVGGIQKWVKVQENNDQKSDPRNLIPFIENQLASQVPQKLPQAAQEATNSSNNISDSINFKEDVQQQYIRQIEDLNKQIKYLKNVNKLSGQYIINQQIIQRSVLETPRLSNQSLVLPQKESDDSAIDGEVLRSLQEEVEIEENDDESQNKRYEYEILKNQYQRVQQSMELKENQLQRLMNQTQSLQNWSSVKNQYENKLQEVEKERDKLLKDRLSLAKKAQESQMNSTQDKNRVEKQLKFKIEAMDDKLKELKQSEREYRKMLRLKEKAENTCSKLQDELTKLKSSKTSLSKKIDDQQKQFEEWRRSREREITQLKRQGNRTQFQLNKLQQERQKQQMVLQRKTQEAEFARKKLTELQGRNVHRISKDGVQLPKRKLTSTEQQTYQDQNLYATNQTDRPALKRIASNKTDTGTSTNNNNDETGNNTNDANASNRNNTIDHADGDTKKQVENENINNKELGEIHESNEQGFNYRDENACRGWLENELENENKYYQYKRVLEGELAIRTDLNRQLQDTQLQIVDVAAQYSQVKETASQKLHQDYSNSLQEMEKQKCTIEKKIEERSKSIHDIQREMQRLEEDEQKEKGVSAKQAQRWDSVPTIQDARFILQQIFKYASDSKAQSYEIHNDFTEIREENEFLKIELERERQHKEDALLDAQQATQLFHQIQTFQNEQENERTSPKQSLQGVRQTTDQRQPGIEPQDTERDQEEIRTQELEERQGLRWRDKFSDEKKYTGLDDLQEQQKLQLDQLSSRRQQIQQKNRQDVQQGEAIGIDDFDREYAQLIKELDSFDRRFQQSNNQSQMIQGLLNSQQQNNGPYNFYHNSLNELHLQRGNYTQEDFNNLTNRNPLYHGSSSGQGQYKSSHSSQNGQYLKNSQNLGPQVNHDQSLVYQQNDPNIKRNQSGQGKSNGHYNYVDDNNNEYVYEGNSQRRSRDLSDLNLKRKSLGQIFQHEVEAGNNKTTNRGRQNDKQGGNVEELHRKQSEHEKQIGSQDEVNKNRMNNMQQLMKQDWTDSQQLLRRSQEYTEAPSFKPFQQASLVTMPNLENATDQSAHLNTLSSQLRNYEGQALQAVNNHLQSQGQKTVNKLTTKVMKIFLRSQQVNGFVWQDNSNKKRQEYIDDIREVVQLQNKQTELLSGRPNHHNYPYFKRNSVPHSSSEPDICNEDRTQQSNSTEQKKLHPNQIKSLQSQQQQQQEGGWKRGGDGQYITQQVRNGEQGRPDLSGRCGLNDSGKKFNYRKDMPNTSDAQLTDFEQSDKDQYSKSNRSNLGREVSKNSYSSQNTSTVQNLRGSLPQKGYPSIYGSHDKLRTQGDVAAVLEQYQGEDQSQGYINNKEVLIDLDVTSQSHHDFSDFQKQLQDFQSRYTGTTDGLNITGVGCNNQISGNYKASNTQDNGSNSRNSSSNNSQKQKSEGSGKDKQLEMVNISKRTQSNSIFEQNNQGAQGNSGTTHQNIYGKVKSFTVGEASDLSVAHQKLQKGPDNNIPIPSNNSSNKSATHNNSITKSQSTFTGSLRHHPSFKLSKESSLRNMTQNDVSKIELSAPTRNSGGQSFTAFYNQSQPKNNIQNQTEQQNAARKLKSMFFDRKSSSGEKGNGSSGGIKKQSPTQSARNLLSGYLGKQFGAKNKTDQGQARNKISKQYTVGNDVLDRVDSDPKMSFLEGVQSPETLRRLTELQDSMEKDRRGVRSDINDSIKSQPANPA